MPKILSINEKSEKRFNEEYAYINYFKKKDSIANIYRQALRDENDNVTDLQHAKYLRINGIKVSLIYDQAFYEVLWCQYFKAHPNLYKELKSFNKIEGISNERTLNVIKSIHIMGTEALLLRHSNFINILSNTTKVEKKVEKDESAVINNVSVENNNNIVVSYTQLKEKFKGKDITYEDAVKFAKDNIDIYKEYSKDEIAAFVKENIGESRAVVNMCLLEKDFLEENITELYRDNTYRSIKNKYFYEEEE